MIYLRVDDRYNKCEFLFLKEFFFKIYCIWAKNGYNQKIRIYPLMQLKWLFNYLLLNSQEYKSAIILKIIFGLDKYLIHS